jgi:hypothetical protein
MLALVPPVPSLYEHPAPCSPQTSGGSKAEVSPLPPEQDPVLCCHCGRTASNGISCQGICVADSGY